MTHRKPLFWIGAVSGILLLLTAVLAVYLGTRSNEWWRTSLSTALTQVLGRKVEIQGEFHIDLGRRFNIEAESILISNPDWASNREMLTVGSLKLGLDLLSILDDTLLIYNLQVSDVKLALEESPEGKKNWVFTNKPKQSVPRKPAKTITLPVHIEKFILEKAQLSLVLPKLEQPARLRVDTLAGGQTADDEVVFDGHGQLGELPFSLKGKLAKLSSILNSGPASYELNGNLGKTQLHSKGRINSLVAPFRPELQLSLSGPEITQITDALGMPTIAKGPFDARIDMMLGGRGVSSRIRGRFGKLQLHADISAENLISADNIDVTASLSGENLAAFAKLVGLPPLPKDAFALDTKLQRNNGATHIDKMVANIGKHHFSVEGSVGTWPVMKDTRLAITAEGPDLAVFSPAVVHIGLAQLPRGAYTLDARLESGKSGLNISDSRLTAGDYKVTAEGNILTQGKIRAKLNVTGNGPDLSMITRLVDIIPLPALPFQVSGRIDITGSDITLIGAMGTVGKHRVAVDGSIAFSAQGPLKLDVKGNGPSLREVLKGLGYDVIPAAAAYEIEGNVELVKRHIIINARHARLGPAVAVASLKIPDLRMPSDLVVDVRQLKMTDTSAALALVGVKIDLKQVVESELAGKIKRSKDLTELSRVRGTIGSTSLKINGTIGDPPDYEKTQLGLDIRGEHLEYFLSHSVEKPIPFQIKGDVAHDQGYTRFRNLQLRLAEFEARLNGNLSGWQNVADTEFTVSARGPDLEAIAAIIDRPLPGGAIRIDGHVTGSEDTYHIDEINIQLGRSNLGGDLKLKKGEPPLLRGKLNSRYIDFALIKKQTKTEEKSDAEIASATKISQPEKTDRAATTDIPEESDEMEDFTEEPQKLLFEDVPIELGALEVLDLDLDIHVDELGNFSEQGALQDLEAKVFLRNRDFSVSNFSASGAFDSKLDGNLEIKQENDITSINIDITGEKLHLGLAAAPGQDPATYPPTDMDIKLTGSGSTYHKLVTSLDGRIKMVQGQGLVSNSNISLILSDMLYEVFLALNPFTKSEPTTRLDCGVYIVNFGNATAEIQDFVFQTDKLTIISAGTINLDTEKIDVGFSTRPRKGLGISASIITNPYIKIGGTLAKPALVLDPERAAIATGAAVATGGLSFLFKGVWDRYLSSRDPCGDALKKDTEIRDSKTGKKKTAKPAYTEDNEEDTNW